jgi:hypothetical protein
MSESLFPRISFSIQQIGELLKWDVLVLNGYVFNIQQKYLHDETFKRNLKKLRKLFGFCIKCEL